MKYLIYQLTFVCTVLLIFGTVVHGANFRVKRKKLDKQQGAIAAKGKDPWLDKAQSYLPIGISYAAPKPNIAEPFTQLYRNPMNPPTWLVHKDLEPPGLPMTPPPPPPEMPPPLYEGV